MTIRTVQDLHEALDAIADGVQTSLLEEENAALSARVSYLEHQLDATEGNAERIDDLTQALELTREELNGVRDERDELKRLAQAVVNADHGMALELLALERAVFGGAESESVARDPFAVGSTGRIKPGRLHGGKKYTVSAIDDGHALPYQLELDVQGATCSLGYDRDELIPDEEISK